MAGKQVPSWPQVSGQLGASWNSTMEGGHNPWGQVENAAQFGYEKGVQFCQVGAAWDDVKGRIEQEWEANVPHPHWQTWYEAQDAAKLGFDRALQELQQANEAA